MLHLLSVLSIGAASAALASPPASTSVITRTIEWRNGGASCASAHLSALDASGNVVIAREGDGLAREIREHFNARETVLAGVDPARGGGFDVQFLLDPAVAADAEFVAAIEQAAAIWESVIADDVTIFVEVGFTSGSGFIGAASSDQITVSFSDFRNAAIADASSDETTLVAALPNPLPLATFDGSIDSSDDAFGRFNITTANARALGLSTSNGPAAPDASIVFNTDFAFDNDPSDGLAEGAIDTVYVMVHEIGHMLGFISGVDLALFDLVATPLDAYRVGTGGAFNDPDDLPGFSAVDRELRPGEEAALDPVGAIDASPADEVYRFSTGGFGDGRQASHWKDDVLLGIQPNIGVMDPTNEGLEGPGSGANPGYLTLADRLAFSLIGWDIELETATGCPADLTGDGLVGADDLASLLAAWGAGGEADLDASGAVTAADLATLVAAWGSCD